MPEERVAGKRGPGKKGAAPYTGQPGRTRACGTAAGSAAPAGFRPRGRNVRPARRVCANSMLPRPSPRGGSLSDLGLWNTAASRWQAQKSAPEGALGNADHWASVSIFRWSSSSCFSVT